MFATRVHIPAKKKLIDPVVLEDCYDGIGREIRREKHKLKKSKSVMNIAEHEFKIDMLTLIQGEIQLVLENL